MAFKVSILKIPKYLNMTNKPVEKRILKNKAHQLPRLRHRTLPTQTKSNFQQTCLCSYQKGDVWPPPSRIACPRATREEIGKARLHAKQAYTWFLDPRVKTNLLLPSGGRFWRQVRGRRQCEASHQGPRRALRPI